MEQVCGGEGRESRGVQEALQALGQSKRSEEELQRQNATLHLWQVRVLPWALFFSALLGLFAFHTAQYVSAQDNPSWSLDARVSSTISTPSPPATTPWCRASRRGRTSRGTRTTLMGSDAGFPCTRRRRRLGRVPLSARSWKPPPPPPCCTSSGLPPRTTPPTCTPGPVLCTFLARALAVRVKAEVVVP